jgi:ATP-binding cassette subfamily B protein
VGPPGSGKTTLLSLIPRIFEPLNGGISIDGIDIRNMPLRHLRSQIAYVPQEPFLFAYTIRENISFAKQSISEAELIRATEDASVYETIQSFSAGFDTVVGEKGVILSGGQKQRIALARAFIHEPRILILDDPISQVDMETGNAIINTVRAKAEQSTIVIVSHRLSAVRFADQIITIIDGHIAESGSHDELMAGDGYYAKTFRLQEIEEQYAH